MYENNFITIDTVYMRKFVYTISCFMFISCGNSTIKDQTNNGETSNPEYTEEVSSLPGTGTLKTITVKDTVVNITVNGDTAGHEYVDLGLPSGTLWATMNLGAKSADNIGNCYAWGETRIFKNGQGYEFEKNGKLTKYCFDSNKGIVDSLSVLQPKDDAATVGWGTLWCMPTHLQLNELFKYCRQVNLYDNYLDAGILLISNLNGNRLYLPLSTHNRSYWSSSVDWQSNERAEYFQEIFPYESPAIWQGLRRFDQLIRPVVKNEENIQKAIKDIDRRYNSIYPYYRGLSSEDCVTVDCKAEYPGGIYSLWEYIKENTVYPEWAKEQGIKGRSIIQFIVEKDGTLSHVDTIRTFNIELDKEAIRVVKSTKGGKPAKKGNVAVRSRMECPVRFGIDKKR